ncbi:MAG: SGNH/GDSL hydrolase family protein [Bacteroidota bacterium]
MPTISADRRNIAVAVAVLLLILPLNEFVLAHFWEANLVDLPGRGRRALYYLPWILRGVDLFILGLGARLLWVKKPILQVVQSDLIVNCLLLLFLLGILALTNPIWAGRYMGFRLVGVVAILLQMLRVTALAYVRGRVRPWLGPRLGLPLVGLLGAFLLVEGVFFFVARPHHTIASYASRIWYQRHWELNPRGHRERDYQEEDLRGKKVLLFTGDSFTAGAGIADPQDRFSDRLAVQLGEEFVSVNLGVNGLGPEGELEELQQFPFAADVLVHVWFLNDIHQAAAAEGLRLADYMQVDDGLRPTLHPADLFYSVNYFWWSFPRADRDAEYADFLRAAYRDSAIRQRHLAAVDAVISHAQARGMAVVVVLFPWLQDVAGSNFARQPVRNHLENRGLPVLDLAPMLARYPGEELVVNFQDSHPNETAHGLVADTLATYLRERGRLP